MELEFVARRTLAWTLCMRACRIAARLSALVFRSAATPVGASCLAAAVEPTSRVSHASSPWPLSLVLHSLRTMAAVELPYPGLPENYTEELKDETGAQLSKRQADAAAADACPHGFGTDVSGAMRDRRQAIRHTKHC